MVYQRVLPYLGRFAMGFAVGFPIAVTFVENVGSVKGVQGISMQVGLMFWSSWSFLYWKVAMAVHLAISGHRKLIVLSAI